MCRCREVTKIVCKGMDVSSSWFWAFRSKMALGLLRACGAHDRAKHFLLARREKYRCKRERKGPTAPLGYVPKDLRTSC